MDRYLCSVDPKKRAILSALERRMLKYYSDVRYHSEYVKGHNVNWLDGPHTAQIDMCKFIPIGSLVLEIGCGDGGAEYEIKSRIKDMKYIGMDLNAGLWKGRKNFLAASASKLPFRSDSIDIVVAMFMIEHLVFPAEFLSEVFRVLKTGGGTVHNFPRFQPQWHGFRIYRV